MTPRASINVVAPSIETRSTRNPDGTIEEGRRAIVIALIPFETNDSPRRYCINCESDPKLHAETHDNVIALGNSGTGKTHVALALGLAACQRGFSVVFTTAAALVHQLMEARDEKRFLRIQMQLDAAKLLIVDERSYVPLSHTGTELLFDVSSQRHERGLTIVTSNLPFDEWTSILGNQRLTGALLDRLMHHVHILEMNGESYRLRQSKSRRRKDLSTSDEPTADPDTGEITPE